MPSLAARIALALEDESVAHDLDVRTSSFRVPLVLRAPAVETAARAVVLTEHGHEVGDVDEALRHAPGGLRARGWKVKGVDARAWHTGPAAVVAGLVATLGEGERVPARRPG